MPRTARASVGGVCYHVVNRGNGRAAVFHKNQDYAAFVGLLQLACERLPMRVLGYCLMPNHFHMVLWPHGDGELSRWMQWLMTSHVRRYHQHYRSSGHVWQGRFKAFPIQRDEHLVTVLRYVEANALRAGLVERAEMWPWSSLAWWVRGERPAFLCCVRRERSSAWVEEVNERMSESQLIELRRSANRGTPYGGHVWQQRTGRRLGLESSLRPIGRPRKK